MILLALESTLLFEHLLPIVKETRAAPILNQFFHHPWHGLHLWDLIQPTFMFVAGVALAFSMKKQRQTLSLHSGSFPLRNIKKVRLVIFSWGCFGLCRQIQWLVF